MALNITQVFCTQTTDGVIKPSQGIDRRGEEEERQEEGQREEEERRGSTARGASLAELTAF